MARILTTAASTELLEQLINRWASENAARCQEFAPRVAAAIATRNRGLEPGATDYQVAHAIDAGAWVQGLLDGLDREDAAFDTAEGWLPWARWGEALSTRLAGPLLAPAQQSKRP